jgi:hypothetical protein
LAIEKCIECKYLIRHFEGAYRMLNRALDRTNQLNPPKGIECSDTHVANPETLAFPIVET